MKRKAGETYGTSEWFNFSFSGQQHYLDFLSDWNDRKHNSKFVALCQKRHFINDTIFMRMLLWPVLISFFVPVIFLYWQQKEGRHAFQYEMFRSAGFVTLMLSAVIIIWLAGALRRTAITLCQLNSLYQLKINAKRDLLWQEDEQKETYSFALKWVSAAMLMFYKQRDCIANDNGIFKSMYFSSGM